MAKILNIGSINIDYVYAVSHFVKAGETIASNTRQIFAGGKGLNQSIAIARCGGDVAHAGAVGDDGEDFVKMLAAEGVDTSFIDTVKAPTGHTIIQVTGDGQNCILLYPGANRELSESFIDRIFAPFGKDDIVVMQNETNCVPYAMRRASDKGMRIAFNPSPFEPGIGGYPLECVSWFILNEIEGGSLTGKERPDDILTTMGEKYPNAVTVLTLGEDGVMCNANGKIIRHGAYKVQVADTTAAGDTFTGYFLSSIAGGMEIEESLMLASKAAAVSVSRKGAAASIPSINEVRSAHLVEG
ncbi:MAG: ribokinase [Spirochaetes bacterium]|nr:ribokinase [Spirochaetota bacterium]